MSEQIIDATDESPIEGVLSDIDYTELKENRLNQWKSSVEAELQSLLIEANTIQNLITSSKTTAKKVFYTKKIKKLNQYVLKYVEALQRLQSTLPEGSTDDVAITG